MTSKRTAAATRGVEIVPAHQAAKLANIGIEEIRRHPTYDPATGTVIFPKGSWLEKQLQLAFNGSSFWRFFVFIELVGLVLFGLGVLIFQVVL